jgi:hypothetical protein
MQFKVLSALGSERAEWSRLVAMIEPPRQDIHFLPEYGLIYRDTYGYEPYLAFYGDSERFVVQPFVKRSLNALPFLKERQVTDRYYDIANAYGFGGPLCHVSGGRWAGELLREFDREFAAYCRDQKIASEYANLHPLLRNHEPLVEAGWPVQGPQKEIVYMDLAAGQAGLWKEVRKGHKSSIQKAKKMGVRVERMPPSGASFERLNRLYYRTMDRNQAEDRWIFPEQYFGNCHQFLGDSRVTLLFACVENEIAAGAILIHDFATVYYHFSGSDERYYEYSPNNLLVFEAALWGQSNGYRTFFLGGGVSAAPDDSLLRFKSGFSARRAPLYSYWRIHEAKTYERLCRWKEEYEIRTNGKPLASEYFPLYRR